MKPEFRTGIGFDVHKFSDNRKLILGGVEIPSELGLLGHSDADVLIHSICDALLGSLALGDIGKHFPDTDPQYKDVSSLLFLKKTGELVLAEEYAISNIDIMLVMEKPKIAPHIPEMRKNIAEALHLDISRISIKATTSETIGFVGRVEGAVSLATVLVQRIMIS